MQLETHPDYWKITPSTGDERRALELIINAFENTYTKTSLVITEDIFPANHLPVSILDQSKVAAG
jgi:hypothetical protein